MQQALSAEQNSLVKACSLGNHLQTIDTKVNGCRLVVGIEHGYTDGHHPQSGTVTARTNEMALTHRVCFRLLKNLPGLRIGDLQAYSGLPGLETPLAGLSCASVEPVIADSSSREIRPVAT